MRWGLISGTVTDGPYCPMSVPVLHAGASGGDMCDQKMALVPRGGFLAGEGK